MINLLPIEQKEALHREYILRLVLIVVSGLIATVFMGAVLLLPSFFLSKTKERVISEQANFLEQKADKETADALRSILTDTKQQLVALSEAGAKSPPSIVVGTALSYKPSGVLVKQVLLDKTNAGLLLSISGTADNREQLTRFSDGLKEDPLFTSVEFPVSNLARGRDIDFTIKVTGDF